MSNLSLRQITYLGSDSGLVEKAFEFTNKAHEGQKRLSGETYITHPAAVAKFLADWKLDPQTVAAGLLHDVVDDTSRTLNDIEKEFGKEIAFLVNGVSKLGKLRLPKEDVLIRPMETRKRAPVDLEIENLRKMFFAMAQDIRVVMIKLADRLHNMQTLGALPPQRQKRIALETLEIFAPIANRLGMGEIKGRLEDLAFPCLYPKESAWLQEHLAVKYGERERYLEEVKPALRELLTKEKINILDIHSRAKHYWSFYQKLLRHEMNLGGIYDLVAMRVIVGTTEDCYRALGVMHQYFMPLPGHIKDYIAFPKPNHYRSLHTTCFCLRGKITEIQIKTREMHYEAEYGIASHWAYKEGVQTENAPRLRKFAWVQQLYEWQKSQPGSKEFLESLKIDFFKNRIFVFTPKGDVIDLPEGATPVDFAYAVHSDIGAKCSGAKVNGKLVPLGFNLANGDVIEIIIDKNKKPSRDWLEFVKTNEAKAKIREFLKQESRPENFCRGIELLNKELRLFRGTTLANMSKDKKNALLAAFPYKNMESLIIAAGEGEISPRDVIKTLFGETELLVPAPQKIRLAIPKKTGGESDIALAGATGIALSIAKCCMPVPGDKILGYITRDRGASIHRGDCNNLIESQKKWPQKIVEAAWIKNAAKGPYEVTLEVLTEDRVGLLRDITSTISAMRINIRSCQTRAQTSFTHAILVKVEISGLEELEALFNQLKQIKEIVRVSKV